MSTTQIPEPTPAATVILHGTPVVSGVAYAPALWVQPRPAVPTADGALPEEQRSAEVERLGAAASAVAGRLRDRAQRATGAAAEVLTATAGMAVDRGWLKDAEKLIAAGDAAPQAVSQAAEKLAGVLAKAGALMAERVTDLLDVRDRVLAELLGEPEPGVPSPDHPVVLFGEDLAPADTAGLDPAVIVGIVTQLGGPTSHTSIIARQLGIPCMVAVEDAPVVIAGTPVLLDGGAGTVELEPDAERATAAVLHARELAAAVATWRGPGRTADGHPVDILANVADGAGARAAAERPVQGIGLFRTELAFLGRDTEPTVADQTAEYREVLDSFPGKKVVIRTLDAGSDKPLKFVDHAEEENPALGVRGIRIDAGDPGLLDRQLDAIAAASNGAQTWVMAPMIATAAEARAFAARCRTRGLKPGVMIEVPAAALCADAVLAEVEFASLGTNDLTQYTMAADRMSSGLAALTTPWQPAVLHLIKLAAAAGVAAGKPVGVCGEAAADPDLACVLVGLGVTSLSCAAAAAPAVGARLASVTLQQCRWAAEATLTTASPEEARAAAAAVLTP
jgi:phosphotransferase system enzyme I (PtsI)